MVPEAKLFVGSPDKVEKAFNRWIGEAPGPRNILAVIPLRPADEADIGFMVVAVPAMVAAGNSGLVGPEVN